MKKSFKIFAAVLAVIMTVLVAFTGCNNSKTPDNETSSTPDTQSGKTFKVGVIQYMSHPSLDNCYAGIKAALTEKYGSNVKIDFQIGSDATADADCAAYAKTMVAQKCDVIIAIATPAAKSAYAATEGTDIPVIFCSVSDPVEAKLVKTNEAPGSNCTGTSDVLDLEGQIDMIQKFQPDVKTIGVLYTSTEDNSISNLKVFKELCDKKGITVEATAVQGASDIPAAATALAEKVDCINNFTDNNVVRNLSVLLDAANTVGIPVYGSEVEQVKNGCLAANSMDYVAIGRITGEMAIDALEGADVATMAVRTVSDSKPVINTEVLESLKMQMPSALAENETVVTNK